MILRFKNKFTLKAQVFLGLYALGTLILLGPSAMAQSSRDTANRIDRLENEVQTLSRAVYRGEKPPPGAFSGDAGMQANTEVRLQQLETELRNINGKLEEQAYEVRQLKTQLERMNADLDMRLGDIESGSGGSSTSSSSRYTASPSRLPAPSSMDDEQGSNDGFQWSSGSTASSASNVPGQLGSITQSPSGDVAPSADAAAASYENAFSLLKNGRYDQAEREFSGFLASYPDHVLAGNAQYWLGESLYVRGEYEKSARVFAEGYQKYPKGSKAADNLLKLGMSLGGLGNKNDACVALGQLETEFSGTSGPVMRRAEQEMTRLGCS